MISLSEVEKRIPNDALSLFQQIFSPVKYDQILKSFRQKRATTFRVNTLKSSRNEIIELLKKQGFKFREVPEIVNGFIITGDDKPVIKSDIALQGKIYFQSISSMMPPVILNPEPEESVLDIASAPGSKTTQMAAMMQNKGRIDAVEPDFVRLERLKYNAHLLNANIISFYHTRGEKFIPSTDLKYDKILVDAPCSGEGRFNYFDKKTYGTWRKDKIKQFVKIQRKLLDTAFKYIKKDGVIVYSTCTLNKHENEGVIIEMFEKYKNEIVLEPVPKLFQNLKERIAPFFISEKKDINNHLRNALRIMPSSQMEGFFICKIKKISE